jgi:hypothetical protein
MFQFYLTILKLLTLYYASNYRQIVNNEFKRYGRKISLHNLKYTSYPCIRKSELIETSKKFLADIWTCYCLILRKTTNYFNTTFGSS